MSGLVAVERVGAVASIALNLPDRSNPMSAAMRDALLGALEAAEVDDGIGAIVLSGRGRGFCGGGDTQVMQVSTPLGRQQSMMRSTRLVRYLVSLPKPIIAAVHGFAVGAGVSLALACDLIVVEESASFRLGFRRVGLTPDMGAHHFLTERLGPWRAKELIWQGGALSSADAQRLGLVNRVVPDGDGLRVAMELAVELAQGPRDSIAFTKSIISRVQLQELGAVMEAEAFASALLRTSEDYQEGLAALREKRPPRFGPPV